MNRNQYFSKMFSLILILIVSSLTIGACASSSAAALANDGTIKICHATGVATRPYNQITIGFNEVADHANHKDDLIPGAAGGCPQVVTRDGNNGKVNICHATSSLTNPYTEIMIDFNSLNGHRKHADDLIPAPLGGCPLVTVTPAMLTGTPAVTTTPALTLTITATKDPFENAEEKITICHATGSKKNPYVMITVSVNGLNGHGDHQQDVIPAPAKGCPK